MRIHEAVALGVTLDHFQALTSVPGHQFVQFLTNNDDDLLEIQFSHYTIDLVNIINMGLMVKTYANFLRDENGDVKEFWFSTWF